MDIENKDPDIHSETKTNYPASATEIHRKVWFIPTVTIIALLFLFGVVTYISLDSAPDSKLYPMRVAIAEPIALHIQFSSRARAEYDVHLMEQRLNELQAITQDTSTTSPETLQKIADLVTRHTNDALAALESDTAVSNEERILSLSKLTDISQALESLSKASEETSSMGETLEDSQSVLTDTLESTVNTFASTSPIDTVASYLASEITEVSESIKVLAQGSTAQKQAIARIENANEDIIDQNYARAILWILKAKQSIAIDTYLFDSERGPVEGEVLPSGEIPEGN